MDLGIIKNRILDFTKGIGKNFIKELQDYMQNSKMTDDFKIKLQNETRDIIKSFGEVYEVKDRGVYKYTIEEEYPEFNRELYSGQANGYYIMENEKLAYDENLNNEINKKIKEKENELLEEQRIFLESLRREGEEYTVDELGDDEKYVYLTRKSNGLEFQDFNITDELYEEIKERNLNNDETILIWDGEKYNVK